MQLAILVSRVFGQIERFNYGAIQFEVLQGYNQNRTRDRMLPEKNWVGPSRDLAERQSNYLILTTLEQKLPPELFAQILTEIQGQMTLPSRLTWSGQNSESTFADLKVAQPNLNEGFLTSLLQAVGNMKRSGVQKQQKGAQNDNLQTLLKSSCERQKLLQNNILAKTRSRPVQLSAALRKEVELSTYTQFKRMKTVFCHADHSTDEVSSIFNVQFDRTGRFIISGADDGIIKVWDRNTLRLQASLHGHFDFITEIDISKCNRFIASAGKDAQVIIWDLKLGRIVKRLTDHQSLINRLLFVAPRVPSAASAASAAPQSEQGAGAGSVMRDFAAATSDVTEGLEDEHGPTSSYVKDQYLLTCSDDGTVHLYDFSPFSRVMDAPGSSQGRSSSSQQRAEFDELRTRRSGRRQTADQNTVSQLQASSRAAVNGDAGQDLYIFDLALTPDDYRPGTRNKKLDCVVCSSAGIVVAGTSTGELFCWKLNFTEIARQNRAESYKYLGQFKICKNAGVQFAEFSPTSDLLMTGSTDGLVKIWRLDIPQGKANQQAQLKTFSMGDESRLVVTIDEKNGCIKTNSISYFDEEGAERFEYQPVPQPVSGQIGFSKSAKDALKFSKSQCDAIKWSVRGRFAIASITSQIDRGDTHIHPNDDEFKEEVCRIKLWDTVNETFYDDLARPSGFQLKKNSWVLAPHPIFEELLMTGCDGGTLLLWNLDTKQILQSFNQYGVYSIDGYQRDNPLDGKFSCDGKAFIVGNQLGTISLFSCEPGAEHQYEATRVQQFFMYDRSRNSQNVFEKIENRPQICGYNMIPHDALPSKPLIGKFQSDDQEVATTVANPAQPTTVALVDNQKRAVQEEETKQGKSASQLLEERKMKSRAFERRLLTAKGLGTQDEKYYQDQLQLCLQESFQPNVLEQGNHQLDALAESSIEDMNGGRAESGYNEDQSLVNALSPPRRQMPGARSAAADLSTPASQGMRQQRRPTGQQNGQRPSVGSSAQQPSGRRRLRRRSDRNTLRNLPDINAYDSDQEMIEDGFVHSPQSSYNDGSEDEASASESSDAEIDVYGQRTRYHVRRENMHEQHLRRQEENQAEQRQRREERSLRRHGNRDGGRGVSGFVVQPPASSSSRRDRVGSNNAHVSMSIGVDVGGSFPERRGRGRPSNAERERRRQQEERLGVNQQPSGSSRRRVIHDDETMEEAEISNPRNLRTRNRQSDNRGGNMGSNRLANGNSSSPDIAQPQGSSTRRNARRLVDSSSSRIDDVEERKGTSGLSKAEKTHNQIIRESGYFLSDREDASIFNYDKQFDPELSTEKGRKAMTQPDPVGTQPDEDYILVENLAAEAQESASRACAFCQKKDSPLVGPFCKFEDAAQTKMIGQPLFFHQDCVEFNQFSRFCIERKKWVNIGKALQLLVHKEQFTCFRCQTKGATVQCRDCSKAFHGYRCARMYTLQLEDDEGNVFYQCMFCRNSQNWEDRVSELTEKQMERQELEREGYLHDKHYLEQLKNINKEHLLTSQGYAQQIVDASTIGHTYNPQVNDFVFYFFQGHEYYMSQYSLHFFCGQLQKFPRQRFMPWFKNPKIKKREFVRCRVEAVEVLFPSQRSLNLIELYGSNTTQVTQTPEIIQRCTLVVVESHSGPSATSSPIKFQVDIFPNSLPDFLIPQATFTEKYERYVRALQDGIAGKTYKVFHKDSNSVKMMRIVEGSSPVEPSLFPNSLWQNIKCVEANPGRSGRVTEMPQHRSVRSRQPALTEISDAECDRVSFWDIQFGGADEIQAIAKGMHVFVSDEKAKLLNTFKDFYEKKREYLECFMDRVPIEIAPDYRNIIPAEMYCNLIMDRLGNCYYRSQEQLLSDIDLISYNAKIYNGEGHDIALNAKELCELIRVKLKQSMFTKSDTLMQQQMAVAGKLTVPSKTRSSLQQKSAIDEMKNSLNDNGPSGALAGPDFIEIPTATSAQPQNGGVGPVMIDTNGPSAAPEEEKKQAVPMIQLQDLIMAQKQEESVVTAGNEVQIVSERQAKRGAQSMGAQGAVQQTTKRAQSARSGAHQQQAGSSEQQKDAVHTRQSSNMGRRRNRINANMIDTAELEEKTKTEAAESAQHEASVNEDEQQTSTKRVTRNLRKRQRQE